MDRGIMDLLPRLPVFGIVARVAFWENSYYGWMRLFVSWRIDDSGLKSLQERYGRNIYALPA